MWSSFLKLYQCLCLSYGLAQTSQDICCVVFALFNVVWATLFLERWKRREAELAYRWGTLDTPAESLEEPRPQFRVRTVSMARACTDDTVQLSVLCLVVWKLNSNIGWVKTHSEAFLRWNMRSAVVSEHMGDRGNNTRKCVFTREVSFKCHLRL